MISLPDSESHPMRFHTPYALELNKHSLMEWPIFFGWAFKSIAFATDKIYLSINNKKRMFRCCQ